MNYIKEMNAFYVEIETNPLSTGAGMLWHTLMHVNNRARWVEEFAVAAAVLCYKAGLSSSAFKRARTELRDKGYITFTSRGTKAPLYRMISLVKEAGVVEGLGDGGLGSSVDQDGSQAMGAEAGGVVAIGREMNQAVGQGISLVPDQEPSQVVSPLYKQNDRKRKNTKKTTNNFRDGDTYVFYDKHFGRAPGFIRDELRDWIQTVGDELVQEAMKRALENKKASWNYVKGILKKWQEGGLVTVDDVLMAEEKYREKRSHASVSGRKDNWSREVVPDWFRELKRKERMEG